MPSSQRSLLCALAFSLASLVQSQVLPSQFTPKAYHLKIDASELATSDSFLGAVRINMTIDNPISSLLLHSDGLTLNDSSLLIMKKPQFALKWEVKKFDDLAVHPTWLNVSFTAPLPNGEYSFYIEYRGLYQNVMAGFAKVGYQFKNEPKYLGVAALEPTHARKVFPCYDAPGYRTQVTLEITVDRPHVPITSVRRSLVHNISDTTKRVFVFDTFPEMPLYQLGWAILDKTSYSLREENTTSTVIHTRAPQLYINQTTWANQLTAQLVQALGKYTELEFSEISAQGYNKIEQIVLPEFFKGTSESFGFMSFSEESLLVSPGKSSARYIQEVGLTLARTVVQQWFGGIISINSWENIWLMKGLDQYLQYVIADSLPEMSGWQLEDQAVVELTQPALLLDTPDSHPLVVTTQDEQELVTTVNDSLNKLKGGAIVRMLKDVFGSFFNQALAGYIKNSYSNPQYNPSNPGLFFNMLYGMATDEKIDLAQKSLSEIMDQWTTAPGYPVLTVTSNSSHFNIMQPNSSKWWVPVTYSLQGSPNVQRVWLQPGGSVSVQASAAKWILLNLNQIGYFRVNYTSQLWQELSKQLSKDLTQLPRLSRSQLIDDAFALDPLMAMEFTSFLQAETDYFPWVTALRHYENLIHSMAGHSSYPFLQNYVLELMNGVISETGFLHKPQDTHIDKLKRSLVLEKACKFGHQTCIQKAVLNLRSWMAQTFYDADLSLALLCAGVANSSADTWRSVWSMYQYSVFPSVRLALLKSLTCSQEQDLLYQLLNNITSVSNPVVSVKDKMILLQTLASKPEGAKILLHWLVNRLKAQVNSSADASTLAPESTTPANTTVSPNSNSSDTSSDQTFNQKVETKLVTDESSATVMPTEKLAESDVTTILDLIVPMVTTLEEGTRMDQFLTLGNQTGLSNSTLEAMKTATRRIYMQADHVMRLNAKLTPWLEARVSATTPGAGGSTTPSTPLQPTSTPKTSAAPRSTSSYAALVSALVAATLYLYAALM